MATSGGLTNWLMVNQYFIVLNHKLLYTYLIWTCGSPKRAIELKDQFIKCFVTATPGGDELKPHTSHDTDKLQMVFIRSPMSQSDVFPLDEGYVW